MAPTTSMNRIPCACPFRVISLLAAISYTAKLARASAAVDVNSTIKGSSGDL